jgi:cellulose synthase (UDP-forming)
MASKAWVDDQRIFFDVFEPAKDAWDAAFCVGTSFVVRRDRLEEIGGFPHEAVAEDINLSYSLMRRGYVTRWLGERLSVGLAAEGLPEYVTQRARWCLGTIQVALLRDGPFRGSGLTLAQRLHYLHGLLNWFSKPFILLMLLAPAVYWFFGVPAFECDYWAFLRHAIPALIIFYSYSGWISRRRTLPVFMEVTHMMTAVAITWTLITCLHNPFGRPFKVTDKGGDRSRVIVRWNMLSVFGSLLAISIGAIAWALFGPGAASEASQVDELNLAWAGISALLSGIACLICFERPRSHREELFETNLPGRLSFPGGELACQVDRLSTVDARIRIGGGRPSLPIGSRVELIVDGARRLRGAVAGARGRAFTLRLSLPESQRRELLVDLYGAPNDNLPAQAHVWRALGGLARRAFGPD